MGAREARRRTDRPIASCGAATIGRRYRRRGSARAMVAAARSTPIAATTCMMSADNPTPEIAPPWRGAPRRVRVWSTGWRGAAVMSIHVIYIYLRYMWFTSFSVCRRYYTGYCYCDRSFISRPACVAPAVAASARPAAIPLWAARGLLICNVPAGCPGGPPMEPAKDAAARNGLASANSAPIQNGSGSASAIVIW